MMNLRNIYDSTSVTTGYTTTYASVDNTLGRIERGNDMSFCCLLKSKNGIVLCSDTRETFADGTFKDDKQKIFMTDDKKIVYGCTGIIKYKNIDYVTRVNQIMDNEHLFMHEKLNAIMDMLIPVTETLYLNNQDNRGFNMFIIDCNEFTLYDLSIENGISNVRRIPEDKILPIAMGKQTYMFIGLSKDTLYHDTLIEMRNKGITFVDVAAQLENMLENIPTINNKAQWISIDKKGNIDSNIERYKN